jgi:cellulose synthase (UDP-forming)
MPRHARRSSRSPAHAIGASRATAFAGGELPPKETNRRRIAVQLAACVALTVSLAYLVWRAGFTLGTSLWISIPLWLLEFHTVVGLSLYAFSLWEIDSLATPSKVHDVPSRIAVFIPTVNETSAVLLPTIAAAVALAPDHETWVLDDGRRPWVRELADALGARYLAREDHGHAKAGNVNHALEYVDAEFVAVLDADHVATEGFLTNTLGYFQDPKVAVVQTPQDFYNGDSFEHAHNRSWFWRERRDVSFNEQRLFYRAIQPGKNRWDAAFWCGTNAVIRTAAIKDVGGVAYETVTEDIHTTIRMHRRGWKTAYHNEVLAYGLAARDASQYQSQRVRWGTGAMQVLHLEHPLTGPGLTFRQRVAYAATLLGWFDAWRTLGFVLVPMAVVFSGANPITAPAALFLTAFLVTFLLQRFAIAMLSRGYAPQGMATLFEFVRMQANIAATLTYVTRGEHRFQVTAKDGSAQRHRHHAPGLLLVLTSLTVVGFVWFGCTLAGWTPISYPVRWTAYGAAFWMAFNFVLLIAAVRRIRSERFASDRRQAVRLTVGGPATLNGTPVQLLDLSVGGALVRCTTIAEEQPLHELEIPVDEAGVVLHVEERSRQDAGTVGVLIGLRFLPGQERELASVATAVISGRRSRVRRPQAPQPA